MHILIMSTMISRKRKASYPPRKERRAKRYRGLGFAPRQFQRGVEVSRYPNLSQCLYDTGTDSIKRTSTWNWGNSEDRHESSDSKH